MIFVNEMSRDNKFCFMFAVHFFTFRYIVFNKVRKCMFKFLTFRLSDVNKNIVWPKKKIVHILSKSSKMGFLTILKKLRQKEKEMRILMLYPFRLNL